jgi:hypothetical protein
MSKNIDSRWIEWHLDYEDPQSSLYQRLMFVQDQVQEWLLAHQENHPVILSLCAGQGRDLLPVLHQNNCTSAKARLIETNPENVSLAKKAVKVYGLTNVEVIEADAGWSTSFEASVPADLLLVCGVFGNISDADVFRTISFLPQMCAENALVIWTRTRRAPDLTPAIREHFRVAGFEERAFYAPINQFFSVGVHQFIGHPQPFSRDFRLFQFN